MLIVQGVYSFRPKRLRFRNDYCLSCAQPRRSVQVRTFDMWHFFWIPILPLGIRKRWRCTVCGREAHVGAATRRAFKWAALALLVFFAAVFWVEPVDPGFIAGTWIFRIGGTVGALLVLAHLVRTPKEPSLKEKLAGIPPASDTVCPFCGTQLLMLATECSCPACGVVRS
jgi:hypothetical protein